MGTLPAGAVIEVDHALDTEGFTRLAAQRVKIGAELARQKVTLRQDGHLLYVVHNGVLAKNSRRAYRRRPTRPAPRRPRRGH